MALKFGDTDLPGEHGPLIFGAPEIKVRTVSFFQLLGEGEVIGLSGGRNIAVRLLLHNKYDTFAKLESKLQEISDLVGKNEDLVETGNVPRTMPFCTFAGWDPLPNDGQQDPGPLPDVAGTLDRQSNGQPMYNAWFQLILLRFRQLLPVS